jgi:Putative Ig domain
VRARSVVLVVLVCALIGAATSAAETPQPSITVIGDSVATGMQWHNDAIAVLQKGLDVDWQVAVCRRLVATSCPFEGAEAPTLVDIVQSDKSLAPVVVVEMGYNELEQTFATSIETAIDALLGAGVKRIVWLNLRVSRHPYIPMNAMLVAAAKRHPEVALVDWNKYSRSHADWFQNDGEHLLDAGGVAMATLIHSAVADALAPPVAVARRLASARVGRSYNAQLAVRGGAAPVTWRIASGRLPRGLELMAGGRIVGTPKQKGSASVTLWATDAYGMTAVCRELVSVA